MSSDETEITTDVTEVVSDAPASEAVVSEAASESDADTPAEEGVGERPTAAAPDTEETPAGTEPAAVLLPVTAPPRVSVSELPTEPRHFPWKPVIVIVLLMGLCGLAFFYLSWSGVLGVSTGQVADLSSSPANDLTPATSSAVDPSGAQSAYASMILTVSMMVAALVFLAAINTALIIVIVVFLRKMIQAIVRLNDSLTAKNDSE